MTSPDPVPLPLGPLAAIVTTEGTTCSATEVTGQALAVWEAVVEPGVALEPDDCLAPTMTPPTTPPTTSAVPSATHTSHRRGLLDASTRPQRLPIRAAQRPGDPLKGTRRGRDYRPAWHTAMIRTCPRQRPGRKGPMMLELINPDDLPTPLTYTHVVIASGSTMAFIAGQEPEDRQGNLVGPGDLAVQARQVFANLGRALAAGGARPEQVTKITIFVVRHRPEYLPVIEEARVALFGDHKPADTVVGVEALARPGYLIEVDAIAVMNG